MLDTHARHRSLRGERRSGDSLSTRLPATPAARLRASLFPVALLMFLVAPPAVARLNICSIYDLSSGDPDDGDHRESPTPISTPVLTDPLPSVMTVATIAPSLSPPAAAAGSTGRAHALRRARFLEPASLWSVVRIWILHR